MMTDFILFSFQIKNDIFSLRNWTHQIALCDDQVCSHNISISIHIPSEFQKWRFKCHHQSSCASANVTKQSVNTWAINVKSNTEHLLLFHTFLAFIFNFLAINLAYINLISIRIVKSLSISNGMIHGHRCTYHYDLSLFNV